MKVLNIVAFIISLIILYISFSSDILLFGIPLSIYSFIIIRSFSKKHQNDKEGIPGPDIFLFFAMGALLELFAESLIGSARYWFIDIWQLLITLPLYLSHLLLFLNLAIYTKKTDLRHLYFWGVLIGLYESWITKVEWNGYIPELPIWGTFHDVALFEYFTLNFFYHPIFSFIVPILVYEVIVLSITGNPDNILPGHVKYLEKKGTKTLLILTILLVYPASFVGGIFGAGFYSVSLGIAGSWAIIYLCLKIYVKRYGGKISIYSFKLGKRGFIFLVIYIVWLYLDAVLNPIIPGLLPEDPLGYFIIILTYVLTVFILIRLPESDAIIEGQEVRRDPGPSPGPSPKTVAPARSAASENNVYDISSLLKYVSLSVALPGIFALSPLISLIIARFMNYLFIALGLVYYTIGLVRSIAVNKKIG